MSAEELEKHIKRLNIDETEAISLLKQLQKPEKQKYNTFDHHWRPRRVKIGVASDLHMGSKFFNYKAFFESVKAFDREKVDAIYVPGDIIEGMSNRDGHIYELEVVGTSNQINHACDLLSHYKQPLFFTTGNHDEWSKVKANQGVIIGPEIESKLPNAKFLGEYTADVKLSPNVTMRLTHEGATAYALSYSLQKRINALEGGTKPSIIFNGHLHKWIQMFYRNIHAYECGTLQNQTPFMAMKGTPAHVGYSVHTIGMNKTGVSEMTTRFFPHY
jgi:predicted phosphodiesterase